MKLGILMCIGWQGGMVRHNVDLARFALGLRLGDRRIDQVVLGVPAGAYDEASLTRQLQAEPLALDPGRLSVRSFTLRMIETAAARQAGRFVPAIYHNVARVLMPDDGGDCFRDCDGLILNTNCSLLAPVLVEKPYVSFVADLLIRYVPVFLRATRDQRDALNAFLTWRAGRATFATTPGTLEDVVGFAGIPRSKAMLLPMVIPPRPTIIAHDGPGKHILWVTNDAPHKNHRAVVAMLQHYYEQLGGTLPVVVAGADSESIGLQQGEIRLPATPKEVFRFTIPPGRMTVMGGVSNTVFNNLVADAAIVFHNAIADNGTYLGFDAAAAGRYFLSSDYPQQRYWSENYGIDTRHFSNHDPIAAA